MSVTREFIKKDIEIRINKAAQFALESEMAQAVLYSIAHGKCFVHPVTDLPEPHTHDEDLLVFRVKDITVSAIKITEIDNHGHFIKPWVSEWLIPEKIIEKCIDASTQYVLENSLAPNQVY